MLLGLPKSLLLNFYYLPPAQAIRLPMLVSHRIKISALAGRVTLAKVHPGVVKIGFGGFGMNAGAHGSWHVTGDVAFEGKARIGCGARLFVDGSLKIGDGFDASQNFILFCDHQIRIGADNQFSWNVTMMDNDGHPVFDADGNRLNAPAPVVLGDGCWIGCDCHVLKGVSIGDGCIVAAASLLNRTHSGSGLMLGGCPARVLKKGVRWER